MNNFENNNCTECYRVIEDLIILYLQLKIRSTEEVSEQDIVSPYFNAFYRSLKCKIIRTSNNRKGLI